MKAKHLDEVKELLALPEFQEWWKQLCLAQEELLAAQRQRDRLLARAAAVERQAELAQNSAADALERAGASESLAAALRAEMTGLDNRAFQLVSDYEEQRYDTSAAWYRLGALEKEVEEKAAAARTGKHGEEALEAARHALALQEEEYRRRDARKNELWAQVEETWSRAVEAGLRHVEQSIRRSQGRRQAEAHLARAGARRERAAKLSRRAQEKSAAVDAAQELVRALRAKAESLFGCCAGEDFLYFRQREDERQVLCVSLVSDPESYNVQVTPLALYSVERTRGVTHLEPFRPTPHSAEQGDSRFEEYFLAGRKGRTPSPRGT